MLNYVTLYWCYFSGGDEPILSYEAVVQQECKYDTVKILKIWTAEKFSVITLEYLNKMALP